MGRDRTRHSGTNGINWPQRSAHIGRPMSPPWTQCASSGESCDGGGRQRLGRPAAGARRPSRCSPWLAGCARSSRRSARDPHGYAAEVAGAISRRTGHPALGQRAAEQVLGTPALRLVALDPVLAAEAGRIAAQYRLRGVDAVYLAVGQTLHLPLYTWDQEIHARAGSFIRVLYS